MIFEVKITSHFNVSSHLCYKQLDIIMEELKKGKYSDDDDDDDELYLFMNINIVRYTYGCAKCF